MVTFSIQTMANKLKTIICLLQLIMAMIYSRPIIKVRLILIRIRFKTKMTIFFKTKTITRTNQIPQLTTTSFKVIPTTKQQTT